ncbi:hypothetical protein D322_3802 [Yersinia enterocolitica IP 10393]|nr:hypothetical protein D322_3802 [Yersinia enterocolitica IP 10393]
MVSLYCDIATATDFIPMPGRRFCIKNTFTLLNIIKKYNLIGFIH